MIRLPGGVSLDDREFEEHFVRASGPGGQNVNKVATAVELRFDVLRSRGLPEPVRGRLLRLAGRRATKAGVLIIRAERFRTQELNRADARRRLIALIGAAAVPPKPRIKTRPPRSAKERRLAAKSRRGEVKQRRVRPDLE